MISAGPLLLQWMEKKKLFEKTIKVTDLLIYSDNFLEQQQVMRDAQSFACQHYEVKLSSIILLLWAYPPLLLRSSVSLSHTGLLFKRRQTGSFAFYTFNRVLHALIWWMKELCDPIWFCKFSHQKRNWQSIILMEGSSEQWEIEINFKEFI